MSRAVRADPGRDDSPVRIVEAPRASHPVVAASLARAFARDPVWSYVFPDELTRVRRSTRAFELMLDVLGEQGLIMAPTDLSAGAVWQRPDEVVPTGFGSLIAALRFAWAFGAAAGRAWHVARCLDEVRPAEPHWYLAILGTDPTQRRRGTGSRLVRTVLERCRSAGTAAYLEASSRENVGFYSRLGFTTMAEVHVPRGPTLWPMVWR